MPRTIVRRAVVSDELEREQRRQDLVRSAMSQLRDARDELHRHQVVILHPHLSRAVLRCCVEYHQHE